MKEWLSMHGEFEKINDTIKFKGGNLPYLDEKTQEFKEGSQYGILLFNEQFFNGKIEATIEFEKIDDGDEAEIIYNYLAHI